MLLIILLDQYACTSIALKQTLSESYRSKGISLKKKIHIRTNSSPIYEQKASKFNFIIYQLTLNSK